MKLFGARANATSPALVLRNAARDISRNRLNLLIEVRHSLHVVQFSKIAIPLDDVVQRQSCEATTIRIPWTDRSRAVQTIGLNDLRLSFNRRDAPGRRHTYAIADTRTRRRATPAIGEAPDRNSLNRHR
jgi:hypothetical protein